MQENFDLESLNTMYTDPSFGGGAVLNERFPRKGTVSAAAVTALTVASGPNQISSSSPSGGQTVGPVNNTGQEPNTTVSSSVNNTNVTDNSTTIFGVTPHPDIPFIPNFGHPKTPHYLLSVDHEVRSHHEVVGKDGKILCVLNSNTKQNFIQGF